uniref:C-type lectin domain-containing protein n=1 Tax=Periophthalmus magnuspinnatus TaxID=409849 RepID=A0A3B3ZRT4_9GOBI
MYGLLGALLWPRGPKQLHTLLIGWTGPWRLLLFTMGFVPLFIAHLSFVCKHQSRLLSKYSNYQHGAIADGTLKTRILVSVVSVLTDMCGHHIPRVESFDGSCFEFVGLQRPFLRAQSWCERGGGHLAFILNDETQQFLQKHLHPAKDWWLGLAPAAPNFTLDTTGDGSLSWLDGSDVSYNNWVNTPEPASACGYIQRHSGFQWEATDNCTQEYNFICQFGMSP